MIRAIAFTLLVYLASWHAAAGLLVWAAEVEVDQREAIRRAYEVPFVESPRFCPLRPGEGNACKVTPSPC